MDAGRGSSPRLEQGAAGSRRGPHPRDSRPCFQGPGPVRWAHAPGRSPREVGAASLGLLTLPQASSPPGQAGRL